VSSKADKSENILKRITTDGTPSANLSLLFLKHSFQSQKRITHTIMKRTKSDDALSFVDDTTATAPVVGRHRKVHSLIGFDPLLEPQHNINTAPDEGRQTEQDSDRLNLSAGGDLSTELRAIATQLEKESPRQERSEKSSKMKLPWQKKKGHRKTKSASAAIGGIPRIPETSASYSPPKSNVNRKKPEQSSLSTRNVPRPWLKKEASPMSEWTTTISSQRNVSSPAATPPVTSRKAPFSPPALEPQQPHQPATSMSPMIQDLLVLQQNTFKEMDSLQIPCLAKPRPTSFLTGKEDMRTSEQDASAWQLEIPTRDDVLVCAKLCQFLDAYRTEECLLDLNILVGCSRQDLTQFAAGEETMSTNKIAPCHRPLVESLLECGKDIVEVKGHVWSTLAESTREVLILERQRQLLCVVRGTDAEQQGKYSKQPDTVHLSSGDNTPGVTVFLDRDAAWRELQAATTSLLDKLTEENPFCDVVFAGHSFGASMATIGAWSYATARPDIRVAAQLTGAPKTGLADFRLAVHSLPNLRVVNIEFVHSRSAAAFHVGHTIKITPSVKNMRTAQQAVKIYKFGGSRGEGEEIVFLSLLLSRPKEIAGYVNAIEALEHLDPSWVTDYYRENGAGVRGKNSETREMA
jgi:hypothetical protein